MADTSAGLFQGIGKGVVDTLLSGGKNAPDDPNWTKIDEFTFTEGYEPFEGEKDTILNLVNGAKLGESARTALVEFHKDYHEAMSSAAEKQWEKTRADWLQKAKDELGGELEGTVERGNKVLEQFGSKELMTVLTESGLVNRVEFAKFLAAIADKVPTGESKPTEGGGATPSGMPAHIRLFSR